MVTIDDETRRYIALFEDATGVTPRDCLLDETFDRLLVVVAPEAMSDAIGPGGRRVARVEERLDRSVEVVADAETAAAFVANALTPAAVRNVTISEADTTVAYAEVPHDERGVAIGTDGRNIRKARLLAARHFDIDDVQLA